MRHLNCYDQGGLFRQTFKLWCLLFPNDATHHTLVHITIRNDKTVDDLKEAIKPKDCHPGKHYNATKLLLYKLNKSLPIAPAKDLSRRIKNKGDIKRFTVLLENPTHQLRDVFEGDVDDMRLHFLVKLPLAASFIQKKRMTNPLPNELA